MELLSKVNNAIAKGFPSLVGNDNRMLHLPKHVVKGLREELVGDERKEVGDLHRAAAGSQSHSQLPPFYILAI